MPERIGVHRPNMELETVLPLWLCTVIADRHRQEVEHQVRVCLIIV